MAYDRRSGSKSFRATGPGLVALGLLWPLPAAAETARASLSVTAIVAPACSVSTASFSRAPASSPPSRAVAVACSAGGSLSVAVEPAGTARVPARPAATPPAPGDLVITVSY